MKNLISRSMKCTANRSLDDSCQTLISLKHITNKTNNELNEVCQGITTDSRLVKKGDIFIALKGKKTNGNLFIDSAINNGAGMVICDRIEYSKELKNIVKVESSKNYLIVFFLDISPSKIFILSDIF